LEFFWKNVHVDHFILGFVVKFEFVEDEEVGTHPTELGPKPLEDIHEDEADEGETKDQEIGAVHDPLDKNK
jgi:hypothetical protein